MDVADAGHEAGVRSVVVSNGYMQEESLKAAYGKMDAVKIDLKAFSEKSYYRDVVTGQLKPVLDSLVTLKKMGKWTEIVYLVTPATERRRRRNSAGWRNGSRLTWAWMCRCILRSFIRNIC